MLQLARAKPADLARHTVATWLADHGQSAQAIERFWGAVLVSRHWVRRSIAHPCCMHKRSFSTLTWRTNSLTSCWCRVSLSELYDVRLTDWLRRAGVNLRLETAVDRIDVESNAHHAIVRLNTSSGQQQFDAVVVAVPWQRVKTILAPPLAILPELAGLEEIQATPIAGVHLWFDRPITTLEHAALVDMLSQWLFRRTDMEAGQAAGEHYYQVVVAPRITLTGATAAKLSRRSATELRDVFPAAHDAKLLRWKLVADPMAVFSVRPGIEAARPRQATSAAGLYLAGDWTKTGWPSTMEGAVRSGYLAAEAVLRQFGEDVHLLANDLPQAWLTRLITGRRTES